MCFARNVRASFLLAMVCLTSLGCGAAQAARAPIDVKQRFSFEFGCANARVTTTPIRVSRATGHISVMGAEGCGHRAVYVYSGATGVWVMNSNGETTSAEGSDVPATASTTRRGPEVVVRRDGDRVSGVRVRIQSTDAQMDFLFLPANGANSVLVQLAPTTPRALQSCAAFELHADGATLTARVQAGETVELALDDILRAASSAQPLQARFCGRTWTGTMQDSLALRRLREAVPPPPTQAAVRPHVQRPDAREAVVRQRLTEAAAIAHACTGSDAPIGVEAEWNIAGQVTIRLRGVEDAAVNRCLEAGLGTIDLPLGGSGRVVHAVP